MTGLRIARDLILPIEAVTETFGILAKRGAGKSNAAVVLAEAMYDAGLPWVAVDPKGDWWGVLSNKAGTGPGLPVLILGGLHGHLPLEPTAGEVIADLIAKQRLTCIVDVSLMSKTQQRTFLADFAERLYLANTEPLHVFAEEAHDYIPQRVTAGDARMVGAWEKLVKWGRTHGLGVTLITQRSASLNNDVLTQVETLIVLRTTHAADVAQIKGWVDAHEADRAMLASLKRLPNGTAFVVSPQWLEYDEPRKVTFLQRRTFDSGATPTAGKKITPPRTLADVDLTEVEKLMAATIEKARADDPKHLRAQIRDLEKQLAAAIADKPEPVVERVEVPVLAPEIIDQLEALLEPAAALLGETQETLLKHRMWAEEQLAQASRPRPTPQSPLSGRTRPDTGRPARAPAPASRPQRTAPGGSALRTGQGTPTDAKLGKTERNVLTVLAIHGASTHAQICVLAGYSTKASTVGVALSKLRKLGYVTDGQPVTATDEGLAVLGTYEPLPTGQALIDYWRGRFGKTEQVVLDAILSLHPHPASQAEVCEITGYSPTASTVGVAASKLRRVGVLEGWALSAEFAQGAGL